MRESFPRQVDKESRGPQGERGLEFSRRKKGQPFFFLSLHSLGLYNNNVSCLGTVSGLRTVGEGNGTPLQYSCLENPMSRGAMAPHGVAKSWTRLSYFSFTFHFHALEKEPTPVFLPGESQRPGSLENPRDRGAWWAAVYGVAQSQIRLKRLSSSSSTQYQKSRYLPDTRKESGSF